MAAASIQPQCRAFRVPKRGHDVRECQDAYAIAASNDRIAVSDGAAESAHAALWASMLVEEVVTAEECWPGWIARVQRRFAEAVQRPEGAEPLPWFLEGRHHQGAFATFLGLTIDGPTWRAIAVGDSCLVQVRDDVVQVVYPIEHSSQFDSTPWLIGSHTSVEEVPRRRGLHLLGECRPGDRFWLMTDALARWFLCRREAGGQPWRELTAFLDRPDEAFAGFVDQLRGRKQLRNDDTTLVAVWL